MYEGRLIRLRELRLDDAEKCKQWLNTLDTAHRVRGGAPMPMTIEGEREFISSHAGLKDDQNHFGVETLDGNFLGVCSYSMADWTNRNAIIGWFIGDPASRGKGYGSDMIKTLLRVCFMECGFHKVYLDAFAYNEPAIRLYERLGFLREGVFREKAYAFGKYWDEMRYSMLRTEYDALQRGEN